MFIYIINEVFSTSKKQSIIDERKILVFSIFFAILLYLAWQYYFLVYVLFYSHIA